MTSYLSLSSVLIFGFFMALSSQSREADKLDNSLNGKGPYLTLSPLTPSKIEQPLSRASLKLYIEHIENKDQQKKFLELLKLDLLEKVEKEIAFYEPIISLLEDFKSPNPSHLQNAKKLPFSAMKKESKI
jgi:hypothetical protein